MSTDHQDGENRQASFDGVYMAGKPATSRWNIRCHDGLISSLTECSEPSGAFRENGTQILTHSLCHPHIHLDKCFLLQHPKYADLEIQKGDFAEAMQLTSMCLVQSS